MLLMMPKDSKISFISLTLSSSFDKSTSKPKYFPRVINAYRAAFKSGFIPGVNGGIYASTVETQLRQTMRNLLDGLEEAGLNFSNVVSSNVYLDNMDDFPLMNGVYAQYFGAEPPARTTVQQILPRPRAADARGHWPTLEQISIIAVK